MPNRNPQRHANYHPQEYFDMLKRRDTIQQATGDVDAFSLDILKQIEWTRCRYNFTAAEMMYLMDLREFADSRQGTMYRRLMNRIKVANGDTSIPAYSIAGDIKIPQLISFCYIFGYDLESLVDCVNKTREVDDACLMMANSIYSLSLDTLKKLRDEVAASRDRYSTTLPSPEVELFDLVIATKEAHPTDTSEELLQRIRYATSVSAEAEDLDAAIAEANASGATSEPLNDEKPTE